MNIYSLYVKTHNKTGLKYLGQTKRDPYKYVGSGVDWIAHLVEHGKDVSTIVLSESTDKKQINDLGRYYSKLWNVIGSADWANKIPESGGGPGHIPTAEERIKISNRQKGDNNVSKRPDFKEKHSGKNHWMNRIEHADYVHIMNRSEIRDSVSGRNSGKYNHTIYTFKNIKTDEVVNLTMHEFRHSFNLDQSCVSRLASGVKTQYKNWIKINETYNEGEVK